MTHAQDQQKLRDKKKHSGLVRIELWVPAKWKARIRAKVEELIAKYKD